MTEFKPGDVVELIEDYQDAKAGDVFKFVRCDDVIGVIAYVTNLDGSKSSIENAYHHRLKKYKFQPGDSVRGEVGGRDSLAPVQEGALETNTFASAYPWKVRGVAFHTRELTLIKKKEKETSTVEHTHESHKKAVYVELLKIIRNQKNLCATELWQVEKGLRLHSGGIISLDDYKALIKRVADKYVASGDISTATRDAAH